MRGAAVQCGGVVALMWVGSIRRVGRSSHRTPFLTHRAHGVQVAGSVCKWLAQCASGWLSVQVAGSACGYVVQLHACGCMCIFPAVCAYMHIFFRLNVHVHVHVCVHACVCMSVCVCARVRHTCVTHTRAGAHARAA